MELFQQSIMQSLDAHWSFSISSIFKVIHLAFAYPMLKSQRENRTQCDLLVFRCRRRRRCCFWKWNDQI